MLVTQEANSILMELVKHAQITICQMREMTKGAVLKHSVLRAKLLRRMDSAENAFLLKNQMLHKPIVLLDKDNLKLTLKGVSIHHFMLTNYHQ